MAEACILCRRRQLYEADPVNSLKLSSYLRDAIQTAMKSNYDPVAAAFSSLDPSLGAQLQQAIAS